MNTSEDKEFDYYSYTQTNPPDASKIQRGTEPRMKRFETKTLRDRIRIDQDILTEFDALASHEKEREQLINKALREWISAKSVKELVQRELSSIIRETLKSGERNQLRKMDGQGSRTLFPYPATPS